MAATFFDLLGAALVLLPPEKRGNAKEYAAYSLEWAPMAANANKQKASFTVDANADFVGILPVWYATDNGAPPLEVLAPQLMFNMNISGGRQMFDKDAHLKNAFGQQTSNGFPMAFPLWVPRTGTLNGLLTDLANTIRNVRITFHGFHLYDRAAATNKAGGF